MDKYVIRGTVTVITFLHGVLLVPGMPMIQDKVDTLHFTGETKQQTYNNVPVEFTQFAQFFDIFEQFTTLQKSLNNIPKDISVHSTNISPNHKEHILIDKSSSLDTSGGNEHVITDTFKDTDGEANMTPIPKLRNNKKYIETVSNIVLDNSDIDEKDIINTSKHEDGNEIPTKIPIEIMEQRKMVASAFLRMDTSIASEAKQKSYPMEGSKESQMNEDIFDYNTMPLSETRGRRDTMTGTLPAVLQNVCHTNECLQKLMQFLEWRKQNGYPDNVGVWKVGK